MITEEDEIIYSVFGPESARHIEYRFYEPIYHYTSPDGMLNILKGSEPVLWFTQYDSLSDTTEGTNIIERYEKVCKDLLDNKIINDNIYNGIIDIKPLTKMQLPYKSEYTGNRVVITKECVPYICCFSKARDSVSMWRHYVKNNKYEGYNICFDFPEEWDFDANYAEKDNRLNKDKKIQDHYTNKTYVYGYKLEFYNVIYDDTKKEDLLRAEITRLCAGITEITESIKKLISRMLQVFCFAFKSKHFAQEEEVRAVIWLPKEGNEHFPVKYRSVNGYIIPYIEFRFNKEAVNGITIAPVCKDEIVKKNIEQMLRDYRYNVPSCNVINSKIPIRY